jgi:hypothetical protein
MLGAEYQFLIESGGWPKRVIGTEADFSLFPSSSLNVQLENCELASFLQLN